MKPRCTMPPKGILLQLNLAPVGGQKAPYLFLITPPIPLPFSTASQSSLFRFGKRLIQMFVVADGDLLAMFLEEGEQFVEVFPVELQGRQLVNSQSCSWNHRLAL